MSGLDAAAVFDAMVTHLARLGLFDRVASHEPENAPGHGLTAVVTLAPAVLSPVPAGSGLAVTSARVTLQVQIYQPMSEPADGLDPVVLDAAVKTMASLSGDFTLGGLVRCVDLLGQSGEPMGAVAAYAEIDAQVFRLVSITVPLLVNDVWEQVP